MARRGNAATELQVREVADLEPETPAEADLQAAEDAVLAACDAGDDNVTWDVRYYKLDKAAGNAEEYMFSVLPPEMDGVMDRIRDTEGTGAYRMRAYRKMNGRNAIFKQHDFRVRAPLKPAAPVERPSELGAILAAMKEQAERNERLLRDLMTARTPEPQQRNPLDDLEKLTTVMKNLMPATPAVAAQAPQDLTGVFVKGVEFAEKIVGERGGDGDGDVGIWGMAKEVIKNLPALAAVAQAQQPQPRRPAVPARQAQVRTAPQPAPANLPPAPPQQPQGNDAQAEIREAVQYLVTRAERGSDAMFYADWITENMEVETLRMIVNQPDPIALATMLEPRVAMHRQWFETFIAELRNLVNIPAHATRQAAPSDIPNVHSRGNGGNSGDAANHVPLGEGWKKATRN
jgi:hypothetical protein